MQSRNKLRTAHKNPKDDEKVVAKEESQKPAKKRKISETEDEPQQEAEEEEEQEEEVTKEPEVEEKKPRPPTKRKAAAPLPPPVQPTAHQTYVMKLYDRSLDLARFKEDDPLYVICRDWLKNNPRAKRPKPEPVEQPLPRKSVPEILTMIRNGINADIKFLPTINKMPGITRYPGLLSFQKNPNKDKINLKYVSSFPSFTPLTLTNCF